MSAEKTLLQKLQESSYLSGNSADYIEDLYESYLTSPQSVSPDWRNYFQSLENTSKAQTISHAKIRTQFQQLGRQHFIKTAPVSGDALHLFKQEQVKELINAYRTYGHFYADTDPLAMQKHISVPELELSFYGLDQNDLNTEFNIDNFGDKKNYQLQEIIAQLKNIYCNTIGAEYMYVFTTAERAWFQQRLESNKARPTFTAETKRRILENLIAADGLEKYLGAKYVGQKRFSLEGGDSLIPLIDHLIQQSGKQNVKEVVMGMAHRGRLNVLVNVLGKSPQELFAVFEGKNHDIERSGDVKYHLGFSSDLNTPGGVMHVALAFNPSHLEIVSPVVEGSVRSRQCRRNDNNRNEVIPIQMHGDAAFIGQGVVMETFSLSQTRGFTTGGTIHIVINNQVGFTTSDPRDARSSYYCTDVAKMINAPVLHVNGDDPEAVVFVAQLALDYRMTFNKDIVIDLVCYRRHGHNEADEPAATQPMMYQNIKQHPTPRAIYAEKLLQENIIQQNDVDNLVNFYRDLLDAGKPVVPQLSNPTHVQFAVDWSKYLDKNWTEKANTAVDSKTLKNLANKLEKLPEGMVLQPQVAKLMEDRRKMTAGELPINWGYAETMAYATLLNSGYNIRMTGQDCGRGTFAHRHAILHDYNNDTVYIPLQNMSEKQGRFDIFDSLLSEEAVLGFEYGYATAAPESLILWEAQFGDFANGAQVVIDQFISSGDQKWGRLCGLVMLLPHGYEGQGPEHSSARLERYLQLCSQQNIQVCIPTTPAQIFHLLRRQLIRPFRKPLIIMTPKSILRHRLAVSNLDELSKGAFNLVLPEIDDINPENVRRVVLCTGKVYYDLLEQRRTRKINDIAIIRLEQLYPFPDEELRSILGQYKKAKELIWCQEEPRNQGAWFILFSKLKACLLKGQILDYAGRPPSASPASGYASVHLEQQKELVDAALK